MKHRDKARIVVLSAGFLLAALVSMTVGFVLEWSTAPESGERTEVVAPNVTEAGDGSVMASVPDPDRSEP
ncbi:MAG: hypothetical protein OEN56_12650 [Gemmatimonadota bacterium]|nr:hypothetical protein [Gemmatimonadota bacterium]